LQKKPHVYQRLKSHRLKDLPDALGQCVWIRWACRSQDICNGCIATTGRLMALQLRVCFWSARPSALSIHLFCYKRFHIKSISNFVGYIKQEPRICSRFDKKIINTLLIKYHKMNFQEIVSIYLVGINSKNLSCFFFFIGLKKLLSV